MKRLFLMTAVLAVTAAGAQTTNSERSIQVNAVAEKEIVPDEIYLRITINENDLKNRETMDDWEQKMIAALSRLGIDTDNNLKIGDMSSSTRRQLFGKNTGRSTTYQLKVDGAQMLARVYQALNQQGVSSMSITKLTHTRIDEFENELRADAVRNARKTAEVMAAAAGRRLGEVIEILDYSRPYLNTQNDIMYSMPAGAMAGAVEVARGETELDFRNVKLSYSVTVKFELL